MTIIENLRKDLSKTVTTYPQQFITETDKEHCLSGTAFFPVGDGLYKEEGVPDVSKIRIMILGQDFGTVGDVERVADKGGSEAAADVPTWNNLLKFILPLSPPSSLKATHDCKIKLVLDWIQQKAKNN